jgi:hypothetical protein
MERNPCSKELLFFCAPLRDTRARVRTSKVAKPSPEFVAEIERGARNLRRDATFFHGLCSDDERKKRSVAESRYLLERARDPKMPSLARGHLIGATNPRPSLVKDYEAAFSAGGDWERSWVILALSQLPDPAGIDALEKMLPRFRPSTSPGFDVFGSGEVAVKRLPRIFALDVAPILAYLLAELVRTEHVVPLAAARQMGGLFMRRYAEVRETLLSVTDDDPYFWFDNEPYSEAAVDATACIGALAKVPADIDVDEPLRDAEKSNDPYLSGAAVLALLARGRRPSTGALRRVIAFPATRLMLLDGLRALGRDAATVVPAAQRTPLKMAEGSLAYWCSLDDPPAPKRFDVVATKRLSRGGRPLVGEYVFLLRYKNRKGEPQLGWAGGFNCGCGPDSPELRARCLREIDEVARVK